MAARRAGIEINDLATEFGVHRATVINHLNRAEVPHRTRAGRILSLDQIEAAGELYASGRSLVEVGERFNVDKRYLQKVLPPASFEMRRPGRQAASS